MSARPYTDEFYAETGSPGGRVRSGRVTVNLDSETLEFLRERASSRGETVAQVLRRAVQIERYLNRDGAPADAATELAALMPGYPGLTAGAPPPAPDSSTSGLAVRHVSNVGIVGADGMPLSSTDPRGVRLMHSIRDVAERLADLVIADPSRLHQLDGHTFEYVVAELLDRQGFDVSVVPPGPDGGVDIFAAEHRDIGSFLYLVQCKRWKQGRPVGLDVVQRLYARVDIEHANAGLVVTTSTFTRTARAFAELVSTRISLQEFNDLQRWIENWRSRP